MIFTTTNSIDGARVDKYLGVITTNLVIGTGFFSDFTASFSDFFGGMSGTYREQMDSLYNRAYEALSLKASAIGANAVLGFKIDFDEISGKGKQMFMVSVSGTAVKLIYEDEEKAAINVQESVSAVRLVKEIFKAHWQNRNTKYLPTDEEMSFIMENGMWELASSLYDYYSDPRYEIFEPGPLTKNFPVILSAVSYDEAIKFIYQDYARRHRSAYPLIVSHHLFHPASVLGILWSGELDLGIDLLKADKREYTKEDLAGMEDILNYLDNLPDTGEIAEVKGGVLSSKMVRKYICQNGHKSDEGADFCETCGLNIKGLVSREVNQIQAFREKVCILKKLLNC